VLAASSGCFNLSVPLCALGRPVIALPNSQDGRRPGYAPWLVSAFVGVKERVERRFEVAAAFDMSLAQPADLRLRERGRDFMLLNQRTHKDRRLPQAQGHPVEAAVTDSTTLSPKYSRALPELVERQVDLILTQNTPTPIPSSVLK
jgi:hypothetical protein